MSFEFATSARILFGWNAVEQTPALAASFGSKALLVLGAEGRFGDPLIAAMGVVGLSVSEFRVAGEPKIQTVKEGVSLARAQSCDMVVAVGGGSVLDAGKAIAGMARQKTPILDHLEVVGLGKPLTAPALPFIAVPTTAGTGSEVTRNAVLDVPDRRVKVSLRGPQLLARAAIVDPALTMSLPAAITASTGMDALTQLIEPFVSLAANPLTDGFCREGIPRAGRSLETAFRTGTDRRAREDMVTASLLGGLALANAKLGAVHGLAGVLGGTFGLPHGEICARLLPLVMKANIAELQTAAETPQALRRYAEIARIVTGDPSATADDAANWVQSLSDALKIPPLRISATTKELDSVVEASRNASSMKGNPVVLSNAVLREILETAG